MDSRIKTKSQKLAKRIFRFAAIFGFIALSNFTSKAQCSGGIHAGDLSVTTNWQTVNANTYTYYTFTATFANEHFTFSFCQGGGSNSLDTQLEVHDNTGASIGFYNDDACGVGSEIMFTAPAAGTYRISIYEYNCETTTNPAGTLAYKRSDGTNEQDCIGALSVCQATYDQTESYFGYGNIMDYVGDSDCSGLCLDPEDNSVWYTFQVQSDGILDFRITPIDPDSDYDWALFDLTNHDCSAIQNISSHYDLIVSCNAAYDFGTTGANTLTPNTNSDCAPPSSFGSGIINNETIPVSAGEIYYLNIQNWSATQGGYTLDFSQSTASIFDNNPPLVDLLADPVCQDGSFTIHFNENVDCSTVGVGDFILTGPGGPYTITGVSGPACDIGGSMERDYTISFSPAITEEGNYTIEYNGNASDMCGNMASMQTWNFSITSLVDINLTSAASTENQSICEGESIQNITYSTNLADNVTFNGLPTGANGNFDATSGNITISGTPSETGSFNFTINVDGDCGHTSASGTITITENTTPIFSNYGPYCLNQSPNDLPTVSNNGVQGSWTPSESINTNNPGTFTYTFTPDADECAPIVDIEITILDSDSPEFDSFGPYCQNETADALPTTSNNGITGYWTPSVINTNSPGNIDYTFNPTSGDCTSPVIITITTLENPTTSVNIYEPLDCNGENGEVSVSAVGGNTPYNGTGTFPVNSGTHQFTVTDANGCEDMAEITLTPPDPMIGTIEKENDILCAGDRTGKIRINISQGQPEYIATWGSSSQSSNWHEFVIDELTVGIYDVTVTDIHGCTISDRVVISEPAPLLLEYEAIKASCIGNDDGSVEFYVTGGIPPYNYIFNGLTQDTSYFNHLDAGDYSGMIIDQNGCQIPTGNIFVDENPVDCLRIPDAFTPNDDGTNDSWDIENLEMFPFAEVRVFNRWGQLLYLNKNHNNDNWDGTFNGKFVPTGSYLYVIQTYTTAEPVTGIVSVVY
jgi:gliding motility-associated-like protein